MVTLGILFMVIGWLLIGAGMWVYVTKKYGYESGDWVYLIICSLMGPLAWVTWLVSK